MNNKSLIFLAIKSLDIQNQTSLTSNTFHLNLDLQLDEFILDSGIHSDKDLKVIIIKILNSISDQSLLENNLGNNYKRRFRYYFKKVLSCSYIEQSIRSNNILIDKLGVTGLYFLYLIIEQKGLLKLWLYYRNYSFEQLIQLIETKNNLLK
uniref:Uncharacterized protein n=1 Tax=Bangia fuscopurpurea TaxID=101920 RepID=A0A0F6YFS8_BANFU|nr:hypothetical protein 148 [Bangia fuscopurpurea]